MFCYIPGTTVAGIALGALLWWAHRIIFAVVVLVLRLGEFAGIALLATMALVAASLVVGFIEWTARLIRARQAARGACLTCPHPCQQAQVTPGPVQLPQPARRLPAQLQAEVDSGTLPEHLAWMALAVREQIERAER